MKTKNSLNFQHETTTLVQWLYSMCKCILPRCVSYYVNNPTSVMTTQFMEACTISQPTSVVSAHNHHHHHHHYQTSIKASINGIQGSEFYNQLVFHLI